MFSRLGKIILFSALGFAGVWACIHLSQTPDPSLSNLIPDFDSKEELVTNKTESILDYCTEEIRTYDGLTYYLYKPLKLHPAQSYPLIVFYHGGDMHLYKPGQVLPVCKPMYGVTPAWLKDNPCFMLIPQAPDTWWARGKSWSLLARIHRYIDQQLCKEFPIDHSRLYTIGYSAGGTGIFHALAWYPDYYAAAIPIAGWLAVQETPTDALVKSRTAVWSFSSTGDECAAWWATEDVLRVFTAARGNFKLTKVPGGHGAPNKAFNAACNGQPYPGAELISTSPSCDLTTQNPLEWLFRQRLPFKK
ncbi:MAG: hypothetical protein FJ220_01475 [Kiritimatiellaceae bacterium]|nr:hypothetical protein [Kiritimatiellaceae bacterium]